MTKKLTLEEANTRLNSKFSYLTVIKYTGYTTNDSVFFDAEFGEFTGKYQNVLKGTKNHPERGFLIKSQNSKSPERRKKIEKVFLEKYGAKSPLSSKEVQEKIKQTNLEKYGVENPLGSKEIQEKVKSTNLNKYGSQHFLSTQTARIKIKKTCEEKFKGNSPIKDPKIKEKIKQTNLEKYGVDNPMKHIKFQNKVRESFIKSGKAKSYEGRAYTELAQKANVSIAHFHRIADAQGIDSAINYEKKDTSLENIIKKFLIENNIGFEIKKTITIEGKVYKPDFIIRNLIIECDGLYWHSDRCQSPKDSKFHKNRREKFISAGFKPLFFRGDEIHGNTDIVKSILMNHLNLINNKIPARKCQIMKVEPPQKNTFLIDNHLMGPGSGKALGLYYESELVCILQYRKKKTGIEISRFCSKKNTVVLGGLSKILSKLVKDIKPEFIESFVDLRYGNGSSLEKLGFQKETEYVSFKWTKDGKTVHRMKFPGSSGYDQGWYKIWDCGQAKYIKYYR